MITALLLLWLAQASSPARTPLLVSPAWLSSHLHDPDLVLLHVGSDYKTRHIQGAREIAFDDIAVKRGDLFAELPDAEQFRTVLQNAGISDRSHIIVYAGPYPGMDRPMTHPASRLVFTLDAFGFSNVSLLDGGLAVWTAAGGAVTDATTPTTPGTLSPLKPRNIVVDANFVQMHEQVPGYVVVDSRPDGAYAGTTGKVKGHIPGARSLPANSLFTADGRFLPAAELRAIFDKAGVRSGDTVVAYCAVGLVATSTVLAARTLGYKVLLYDGSFDDWSNRHLPVTNPSEGKDR